MPYISNPTLQTQNLPGPPSHFDAPYSDNFILGSTLLQDYPNLLSTYFRNGGKPVPFLNKITAMGFIKGNMKSSDSPFTGHYEKPRPKNFFGISAIVSGGGTTGQAIIVSILATDMRVQVDQFSVSHYYSRPRKGENYQFADGNIYRITNKDITTVPSLHQLTLQPRLSTVNTNAGIVVGAKCFYVNPDKGEGTAQIGPLQGDRFKYQNGFTIIDETEVVSGSNQTTGVAFKPVPGNSNLLYLEGIEDTEIRHEQAKSNMWLWSQLSDQLTDFSTALNTTVGLKGSEGLIPFIISSGRIINFTDVDSYDIDDIFAVTNYYHDLALGTETVMLLKGRNLINRTSLLFKQFLDNTKVSYVVADSYMKEGMRNAQALDPMFNSEAMFVSLEFSGYRIGHINFVETALAEFNDSWGAGQLGFKDVQIILPIGTFQSEDKSMVPYVGLEWRGTDGYSRQNEVWSTSGAGKIANKGSFVKSLADDVSNMFLRSEIAPHFGLGILMAIQKPTATII